MADLSHLSDEELQAIAGAPEQGPGGPPSPAPGPPSPPAGQDLSHLSDADLEAIAKAPEAPPGIAQPPPPPPGTVDPDQAAEKASRAAVGPVGYGETAMRGAAQGFAGGFADEMTGFLAQHLLGKSPADAQAIIDYARKRDAAAQIQHPGVTFVTKTAGLLGNPLVRALPSAGAIPGALGGAAAGGVMGAGESTAPTAGGVARDAAKGAAFGGITGGVLGGASNFSPARAGAVMLGTTEDAVNRYITDRAGVMNSPRLPQAVENVQNTLAGLKDRVVQGSDTARGQLGIDQVSFRGTEVADFFDRAIANIRARSEGAISPSEQSLITHLESEAAPFRAAGNQDFSGSRVKDLVQSLQSSVNYGQPAHGFSPPGQGAIKGVAAEANNALKQASPQYAQDMQGVAEKTALLNQAQNLAKSPEGLMNNLRQVQRERAPFKEATLSDVDREMGTSIVDDVKNSLAREAFEGAAQGKGGSRNVKLYSEMLGKIPVVGHILGPLVGASVDKYGPQYAMKMLDMYLSVPEIFRNMAKGAGAGVSAVTPALSGVSPEVAEYLTRKGRQ